ncbi:zeatin O-glucosyltransferase-like [Solanum dulcamara]|uniref:zeatin O-glucosyltransferase-like n=1 Tax=Solanum dulcamara TaxID=45834 RepID=UPI0024866CF2|nr:zeatin O-glucosyltransferase-like [Solanum dulcamara]
MAENYTTKSNGHLSVQDAQVAVVMVPLPAQGHLNQLLHLSRLITSYNIPVHYVGATTHINQIKFRVHGFDPVTTKNLHFHYFPTPPFENAPPNPNAQNKFPIHLMPSLNATIHLREPVCSLVRQLLGSNHRRVIVIYDSVMTWVVEDVPAIPNTECYRFNGFSAFFMFSSYWEKRGKPFQAGTEIFEDIPSIENCATPELWELWRKQESLEGKISCGELYNSSRVIEGSYLDLVAKEINGLNLWAIGPFNPLLSEQNKDSNKHHQTLYWLDRQETNSVIYVSFGSTTTLSNEEIEELAIGLEKSMQKFIWVLRDADRGDVFAGEERRAGLPEGYEERIKGRGIIVRDWAPQLEILAHPSTGGFMSHCGWNSCMESISMGVPIAAWPMHSDQPRNSQLVTRFLKIGLNVRHWARRDELVTSEIVENAVRTLMASPEGDEMRKRTSELSIAVKQSVMNGGGNSGEMDSFIAHITQ